MKRLQKMKTNFRPEYYYRGLHDTFPKWKAWTGWYVFL